MNGDGMGQGAGRGPVPPETGPPVDTALSPDAPSDEALQSLERLQALAGGPQQKQRPRPPAPARRPRMPSVSRQGLSWPRVVAPVAFLVAVLIVFSFAIQSGVVGGDAKTAEPAAAATGKAKPTSSASAAATYRVYVVKTGDSLTLIADKFNTTVTDLEDLNPKADLTTLQVGQKIKVPR